MKIAGWICAGVGLAVLALGLFLGLGSVDRDGAGCGSAFGGVDQEAVQTADLTRAMEADDGDDDGRGLSQIAEDCKSAVSDRQPLAWSVTALGGITAATGAGLLIGSYRRGAVAGRF